MDDNNVIDKEVAICIRGKPINMRVVLNGKIITTKIYISSRTINGDIQIRTIPLLHNIVMDKKPYCQNIAINKAINDKYKDVYILLSTDNILFDTLNDIKLYRLTALASWRLEEQFNFNR